MSKIWRCDLCKDDKDLEEPLPEWSEFRFSRGLKDGYINIVKLDVCSSCHPILESLRNKTDLIDLIKRMHVIKSSPNKGSEA